MEISPLAGKPAPRNMLVDLALLPSFAAVTFSRAGPFMASKSKTSTGSHLLELKCQTRTGTRICPLPWYGPARR